MLLFPGIRDGWGGFCLALVIGAVHIGSVSGQTTGTPLNPLPSGAATVSPVSSSSSSRSSTAAARGPGQPSEPLMLIDQFQREHTLKDYQGDIVVLVYGDRKATKECRELGEWLHVAFHPQAAELPADQGHLAPVRPLVGLPVNQPGPNVHVIPVACTGPVPKPVRAVVQQQFRKGSPVVPVWLDFEGELKERYGQDDDRPNLVVFDGQGTVRLQLSGTVDARQRQVLAQRIEGLRREAAGLPQ